MKKTILIILIGLVLSLTAVSQLPRPRFVELLREYNSKYNYEFSVWHDKESGAEIICTRIHDGAMVSTSALSCFTTGRKW